MVDKLEPDEIDKLFETHLAPGWTASTTDSPAHAFSPARPLAAGDQLAAICKRMDDLTKVDASNTDYKPEETIASLKEIYADLISVAQEVRSIEQSGAITRSEHDLQMDLEREANRRRQF